MILDANLLLYAEDRSSPHHGPAEEFVTSALNGVTRVGLPWESLVAFARIRTNPRIYEMPLSMPDAWARIEDWISAPAAWIPLPTDNHASILRELICAGGVTSALLPDARLAALAIEHGVAVASADADFARFSVRWINPLSPDGLPDRHHSRLQRHP